MNTDIQGYTNVDYRDHALGSNVRFIHASIQLLTVRPLQMLRYLNVLVGDYLIVHRPSEVRLAMRGESTLPLVFFVVIVLLLIDTA